MPLGQSLPWLNGKSVRGSTPTTRSSFTFKYMPHCWPRKQQCVGTSRSGCTPVSSSGPVTYARDGPNGSVSVFSGMEIAPVLLAEGALTETRVCVRGGRRLPVAALDDDAAPLVSPELPLCQGGEGAPTGRADPLVVPDRRVGALVAEAELPLDRDQVLRVHARREGGAAPPAASELLGGADRLVEPCADLCRTLEDVEQLAERQPEEGGDHGDGGQDGDELERIAPEPGVARRRHEAGQAHGEEQDERQEILAKELQRGGALLSHATPHGEHHPGDDEERRPDQAVKREEPEPGMDPEREGGKPEDERPVALEVAGGALEMEPAEDERERDGDGDQATPHDEEMRQAAEAAAGEDEAVGGEVARDVPHPVGGVPSEPSPPDEHLPAAPPEHGRRRALQPHRIAVREAEGGEQDRGGVGGEGGVEVCEAAGADPDEHGEAHRHDQSRSDRSRDGPIHDETSLARGDPGQKPTTIVALARVYGTRNGP